MLECKSVILNPCYIVTYIKYLLMEFKNCPYASIISENGVNSFPFILNTRKSLNSCVIQFNFFHHKTEILPSCLHTATDVVDRD